MIHSETVSVSLRTFAGTDEYGNDIEEYGEPFDVENVLVGRGDSIDRIENGQPYSVKSDKRFCFPKGFPEDLRGAIITRTEERGEVSYKVEGEPVEITGENIPNAIPWNVRVEAVRYDG